MKTSYNKDVLACGGTMIVDVGYVWPLFNGLEVAVIFLSSFYTLKGPSCNEVGNGCLISPFAF